jgi:hypothetical protein
VRGISPARYGGSVVLRESTSLEPFSGRRGTELTGAQRDSLRMRLSLSDALYKQLSRRPFTLSESFIKYFGDKATTKGGFVSFRVSNELLGCALIDKVFLVRLSKYYYFNQVIICCAEYQPSNPYCKVYFLSAT